MVQAIPRQVASLTGVVKGRRGWFGKVIMQVELKVETLDPYWNMYPPRVIHTGYQWRDATNEDLLSSTAFRRVDLPAG